MGAHLVFSENLMEPYTGIIVPKTSDGRLIYAINYQGSPMVGTTDEKCDITNYVKSTDSDEKFITEEFKVVVGNDYDFEKNVVSSWAGIRPLVKKLEGESDESTPHQRKAGVLPFVGEKIGVSLDWLSKNVVYRNSQKKGTAGLVRNHVIEVSDSGLVSLMGGKWTSFRRMGEETVEKILSEP